jgi:hypothetical protein
MLRYPSPSANPPGAETTVSATKTPPGYPATPALDRLEEQRPARDAIGEFLEWFVLRGYTACVEHTHSDDCYTMGMTKEDLVKAYGDLMDVDEQAAGRFRTPQCLGQKYHPTTETFTAMLDRHFGVDAAKVETERRAVLEHARRRR